MILKAISLTILGIILILLLTNVISIEVSHEKTNEKTSINGIIVFTISIICFFIIQL